MKVIENPAHGDEISHLDGMYPSRLLVVKKQWHGQDTTRTSFGYVLKGAVDVVMRGMQATLVEGCFFSACDALLLNPHEAADTTVVLMQRYGYRGLNMMGESEKRGRLSYIDGCSDTLLLPPQRLGDPCLNHLHFPKGVVQTQHVHPSVRLGIVARGSGHAYQLPNVDAKTPGWTAKLRAGMVFALEEQELHSFRTDTNPWAEGEPDEMDVIAFHPDSDWGPTDAAHPMRSRTYIGNNERGLR